MTAGPLRVEICCPVCGSYDKRTICSAAEIAAQIAYLRRFHRRRLRPTAAEERSMADRAEFTQDYATAIVSCERCGLVFREAHPPAGAVTASYVHDEYGHDRLEALFSSQLELFRGKLKRLEQLMAVRSNPPTVIEVGSFVGGFLAAARAAGWNAVGIDPGEEVAAFCREKGLEVIRSAADQAPIAAETLDCVAIWNTFDQLPDPRPTLEQVQRWLRPNGLLALRVPHGACFRSLMDRLRRRPRALRSLWLTAMAWNNLLAFPYLSGHSPATLDHLLNLYGFTRIAVDGDTLTRLADERTRTWARWEETGIKACWRAVARTRPELAPWLDVYYRRQ